MVIDQLIERIDETSSPIVVGLDPLLDSVPDFIKQESLNAYGNTLKGAAEALFTFNKGLLEVLRSHVPAVKLQMACYELYGNDGLEVFNRTVSLAKRYGLSVIDDSKRNDIGSTAKLYAVAHLGSPPLIKGDSVLSRPDFLTINPYLGSDSIAPFVEECNRVDKGLFILVRTSNPSAADYQEALVGGVPLFEKIGSDVQSLSGSNLGERGYSPYGAVVGATWPRELRELRDRMPNCYFLVPGYGTQGATAGDVMGAFDTAGYGALINSSRGIIFAYQQSVYRELYPDQKDYAKASVIAVKNMRDELLRSLSEAGKLPKNW